MYILYVVYYKYRYNLLLSNVCNHFKEISSMNNETMVYFSILLFNKSF